MGSRAAVMAATQFISAGDAESDTKTQVSLILVSYPLLGPKDVRDTILLALPAAVRVLFIVGDKDAMCPLDRLESVRQKMEAGSTVVVVRGADHGMHVKGGRELEEEIGAEVGRVAAKWVGGEDVGGVEVGG